MKVNSRRHGQRFLWTDVPSTPFVRFQRVSSRQFVVWISAGNDLDIEDLNRALDHGPGPTGVVRSFDPLRRVRPVARGR